MSDLGERPTTLGVGRDLSGQDKGASAAAPGRSREEALFHGYTRMAPEFVSMPCACGGDVTVICPPSDRGIVLGMRTHQRTAPHAAWRQWHRL